MTASRHKGNAQKRDAGGFVAVPYAVLNSQAFINLSGSATKLLMDVAAQLRGDNNGHLYCAWTVMSKRGWRSETTLTRAKQELLKSQLLFETRKGARPNKAGWYAVTWLSLDKIDGMDTTAAGFPRGAYRHNQITPLTPVSGVVKAR